jgi:hypothetical protein
LVEKVLESFDEVVAMSRAGLQRKMGRILRGSSAFVTAEIAVESVMSHAGLGV